MKKLIFLSGMSGSGKTTTVQALSEDEYTIIENLEPEILIHTLEMIEQTKVASKVAVVANIWDVNSFKNKEALIEKYRKKGIKVINILLVSEINVLINRYQQNRKIHPLVKSKKVKTLIDAIEMEHNMSEKIKSFADLVIDTSFLQVRDTQKYIKSYILESNEKMQIVFQSFGFKYGVPRDSDNMIDVRYLPNPYYQKELRKKTGKDKEVYEYVFSFEQAEELYTKIKSLIDTQVSGYEKEGKMVVTISIGCTGGQHRSVAFVERLAKNYENSTIKHLEGEKENWNL